MTKEINLDNSYMIAIKHKEGQLIQYIEANNLDEAIKKARLTFQGNLHNIFYKLEKGSMCQKACYLTTLAGKLRFVFNAGWLALDVTGLTIFEALEKAKNHKFAKGEIIEEIHSI